MKEETYLELDFTDLIPQFSLDRRKFLKITAGGIVIPDSATEKPMRGEVVAVGNGKILDNGEVRSLDVKAGDTVLFGKYSGNDVKVGDDELVIMREDDIMAVIE